MTADLNDIYQLVGELKGTMIAVNGKVDGLKRDMIDSETTAAISRSNMHRRLDDISDRTAHLETSLQTVKEKVERVEGVSDDVVALRHQAQGAGTLGRGLIKLGFGVISIAGWIVGVYTYLTGRPPP